jgi:hypothetical protein
LKIEALQDCLQKKFRTRALKASVAADKAATCRAWNLALEKYVQGGT